MADQNRQVFNKGIATTTGILIILLCAVIAGGIFAWQWWGGVEEAPVGPTANWETYRNEEYGYEIKYPSNWFYSIQPVQTPANPQVVRFGRPNWDSIVEIRLNSKNLFTISGIRDNTWRAYSYNTSESTFRIAGQEALKISGVPTNSSFEELYDFHEAVIFEHREIDIIFEVYLIQRRGENLKSVFNQMLSTFRFIEVKPYIKVLSPNGGEEWVIGNMYEIKWNSSYPSTEKVSIALQDTKYGQFSESPLGEVVIASAQNTGSYTWIIPSELVDSLGRVMELGAGNVYIIAVYLTRPGGECLSEKCDESDDYFSIVKEDKTTEIKVYFVDTQMMMEGTASYEEMVKPVSRIIPATEAVARSAIEELLKGPTSDEQVRYSTSIPIGVKVNSLKIEIE